MKLVNNTHWQTRHLKAFAVRVLRDIIDDPGKRRQVVLRVHHGRGKHRGAIHGLAYVGGTKADVYVPARCCADVDKIQLCRIMAHEFAHLRGLSN